MSRDERQHPAPCERQEMGHITLPNDRLLLAVSEIVSLLAEQSTLYFYDRAHELASANSAGNGVIDRQAQHDCVGDALAERLQHLGLRLEQRAWIRSLHRAVIKSKLFCFRDSTGAPQTAFNSVTESFVATTDLAQWLLGRGFNVTFAPPFMDDGAYAPDSNDHAHAGSHRKLRKSALIDAFKDRWPTIESDVGRAASNGLSAARVDGWHGMYDVPIALQWAKEHGRLRTADSEYSDARALIAETACS